MQESPISEESEAYNAGPNRYKWLDFTGTASIGRIGRSQAMRCRIEDVALVHAYAGPAYAFVVVGTAGGIRPSPCSLSEAARSPITSGLVFTRSLQQITVICAALEREAEAGLVHQSYRWDSDK